jgi:hypothetical protein
MKRVSTYVNTVTKSPTSNPVQTLEFEQQSELLLSQPEEMQQSIRFWILIAASERLVARQA